MGSRRAAAPHLAKDTQRFGAELERIEAAHRARCPRRRCYRRGAPMRKEGGPTAAQPHRCRQPRAGAPAARCWKPGARAWLNSVHSQLLDGAGERRRTAWLPRVVHTPRTGREAGGSEKRGEGDGSGQQRSDQEHLGSGKAESRALGESEVHATSSPSLELGCILQQS